MENSSRKVSSATQVLLCFVCLGTSALAQQSGQSELRASQILALNEELSAAASAAPNPGRISLLLSRRAALLSELIASDPARALALALPQDVSERLRVNAPSGTLEVQGEWEGTAEATIADDFEHQRSRTRWYLRTSQERLEMFFADRPPHQPNVAISVRGMRSANRLAVADIASEVPAASLQCTTTGAQHIAVLMVTTPSVTSFPAGFTFSYFQQLFFGPSTGSLSTDSVNSYWGETSYGLTSATGQVAGPFLLAQNYDCDHLDDMETAAISAADSTVNFTQFTRVALMFPVQDCTMSGFGSLGGLGTVGCGTITSPSKGTLTASTIWMPIYTYQSTWDYLGATAHELGHNLGLGHESTEDFGSIPLGALDDPGTLVEYGSPFSIMGNTWLTSGQQPILGQYSAEHKSLLNWLVSGGYQQVTAGGTFSLAPFESSSGLRALRVLRDSASGAWLWVEYRQPIGDVDSSLSFLSGTNVFNGALIHYENPILDSLHTYLLDFNPVSTPNNFNNAALVVGQSWSDPYSPLTLRVNSATSSALSVTVGYGSAPPAPVLVSPANGATGVSLTPTLTWNASSGATSYDVYFGTSSSPPLATNTSGTSYAPGGLSAGTLYYWQVVAKNSGGSSSSSTWSFTTQTPGPPAPTLVSPSNGATGVTLTPTLTWNASSGATSYDVYFGTSPSPPLATNTSGTSYAPGTLSAGTLYYWRVVAKNSSGSSGSSTWSFTTQTSAPPAPSLVSPGNGATGVSLTPTLTWNAAAGATSYDVHFGTSSPPPLVTNTAGTSYAAGTLASATTYYWQVVAKNSAGSGSSAIWSFTTQTSAPPAPSLVSPGNGAAGISLTPALSWSASSGATSYDVYFGTSSSPPLGTNTTGTSYAPGTLSAGTLYYWRVVAKNDAGSATSATWSFTTQVAAPVLVSPGNGAAGVSVTPALTWNASTGATSYDVYFGTSSPPPLATNTAGTSYAPGTLNAGAVYYWQVAAKNSGGSASSAIWSFTTQIAAPVLVSPANGAASVAPTPTLSWNASTGATSYDVYFGTSSSPPLATSTAGISYAPGRLSAGTLYYWRVAAKNGASSSSSATWSFTTLAAPPAAPTLTAPANGATDVSLPPPVLTWAASTGAVWYDVYLGTSATPPLVGITYGTSFTPGALSGGTLYYWQVVAYNGGGSNASDTWQFTTQVAAPALIAPANGATGVSLTPVLTWSGSTGATSYDVYFGTAASPPLVTSTAGTSYTPGTLAAGALYYWRVAARDANGSNTSPTWSFTTPYTPPPPAPLRFVPVTPCRVADTRGGDGPFGGPTMTGGTSRSFAVPQSACGIPATALAYSLNVTVAPEGHLSYLTLWPTGQGQPFVSTLNSWGGDVVANAAIVPAGAGGAVSVFVTDPTDVILDINGYFDASASSGAFSFYPATPCRVADTRGAAGTFGGPTMSGGQSRDFPVPLSACEIPATAGGYSLNVTVVPPGYLGYLTTWPTGQGQPNASTLNSWKGKVVANAALVPAGSNESISVYVSNPTDVILDIDGYFGQAGQAGALSFYPVTPCRVADTRGANGPFGGPEMGAASTRSFPIPASSCNIPATAAAYSVNVTVVPDGPLSYLTAWPAGSAQPNVSTLNSWDGSVVANAAIVPAGAGGAISIFVTNPTQVILDINGYFAP